MDYMKFSYIYPPRPERKIHYGALPLYSKEANWVAQPKLNGSCAVLFLNGEVTSLWNRHSAQLTRILDLNFADLYRGNGWMVLVGEYMNKNKMDKYGTFNHKFVIWDILVYNDKHLTGSLLTDRIELLDDLYGREMKTTVTDKGLDGDRHLLSIHGNNNLFRVNTYETNFKDIYKEITPIDMYEGLVLKRTDAPLLYGGGEANNGTWQIKCRKATRNYAF